MAAQPNVAKKSNFSLSETYEMSVQFCELENEKNGKLQGGGGLLLKKDAHGNNLWEKKPETPTAHVTLCPRERHFIFRILTPDWVFILTHFTKTKSIVSQLTS